MTNDIGEFRLYGLAPGDYYISATLRNFTIGESDDRSGYAPTYYPGTTDVGAAQRLTVSIGQTTSDYHHPLVAGPRSGRMKTSPTSKSKSPIA
jgi:hypothetical protein